MDATSLDITPDAVGCIEQNGRVKGEHLPRLTTEQIKVLQASKPTAHKLDRMIVCAARSPGGVTLLHCYHKLPNGIKLSDTIAQVTKSAELLDTGSSSNISTRNPQDPIAKAFATCLDLPQKSRSKYFLQSLADHGVSGVIAVGLLTNGKLDKFWLLKQEHELNRDALRQLVNLTLLGTETKLDRDLLANSLGGTALDLLLSDGRDRGVVLVSLDLEAKHKNNLQKQLLFLTALNPTRPKKARFKSLFGRFVIASVIVASLVYLALPAPIYVNNFAQTRAAASDVISLPFGVFLETVNIRAGQTTVPGQMLVRLRAPDIENELSEQSIQLQLEEIKAQEALENGDIAEFQLAEKRKEIARLRETQLQKRADFLEVVSQTAAHVISVQSQSDKGLYLAEGTPVITLQTSPEYDVIIDVKPADAARLRLGQKGTVQFRGLSTAQHTVKIISMPVQVADPTTRQTVLKIKARIMSSEQSDLVHGLDGFAKIDTGQAPRIIGLTRLFREYIKVSLWKYLGFTF